MADLSTVKVEKKDGTQEPWVRDKLVQGMVKAGATLDQAQGIANQVEEWVANTAVNGVIKTDDVRTKVLELLEASNPTAKAAFEAYKKPE